MLGDARNFCWYKQLKAFEPQEKYKEDKFLFVRIFERVAWYSVFFANEYLSVLTVFVFVFYLFCGGRNVGRSAQRW